jgi:hypothetical protein
VSGGAGVTIPHDMLLLVPLVIFAAYLVFGITGFGASPITIPVLVHLLPLACVLPLVALLDLGSALVALALGAGVWVGHRAHLRLAPATAARIIAAALFMAGATLIARTL